MKAFFTGHRDVKWMEPDCRKSINQLIDRAIADGVTYFYSGMALGVDMIAAEELLKRNLPWTAVIPCADQPNRWIKKEQARYRDLLKKANAVVTLYPEYADGVMQARNQWMIDNSQICLTIYDGISQTGGTALTIQMAIAANLKIYRAYRKQPVTVLYQGYEQLKLFEF